MYLHIQHYFSLMRQNPDSPKKPVLVRVPADLYDVLLERAAKETLVRRSSVSVPGLMVEILTEALNKSSSS